MGDGGRRRGWQQPLTMIASNDIFASTSSSVHNNSLALQSVTAGGGLKSFNRLLVQGEQLGSSKNVSSVKHRFVKDYR